MFKELKSVLNWKARNYSSNDVERLYLTNLKSINFMSGQDGEHRSLVDDRIYKVKEDSVRNSTVYNDQERG